MASSVKANASVAGILKQLAIGVYQDPFHFFFELLQNADDCRYPDGGQPTCRFLSFDGGLILHKNEVGFSCKEVRSILGICASSKEKPAIDGNLTTKTSFDFEQNVAQWKASGTPTAFLWVKRELVSNLLWQA